MHTLSRILKRKSILSLALSLVTMMAPHSSLRKHYMDYARVGCDFTIIYPKYSRVPTLPGLMLTRTCGCVMPATHGNIVVYVDNIIVAMKDPKSFFDELQDPDKVGFKMKGVGLPTYHLGADFFLDDDGMLCLGSQTYAKRLCSRLYGEPPKSVFSPLEHDDHLELDDSPFCGPEDTSKFQSLIGACQWMISLCRMDIAQAIMSLSRFRHCSHQGHVDHLKRVCGYIRKFTQGAIRFHAGIPDQ